MDTFRNRDFKVCHLFYTNVNPWSFNWLGWTYANKMPTVMQRLQPLNSEENSILTEDTNVLTV